MKVALLGVQGLIRVSPECNAGIPGHLKNAVDWLGTLKPSPSRPAGAALRGQSRRLRRGPGADGPFVRSWNHSLELP
jgi:NAD(P)H-dependent FMN reductase